MSTEPRPVDARKFRAVLGRFATGIVVLSARNGGACHAMTANAFMSGSLEPPLVVISVARRARMHEVLEQAGAFGVAVLTQDQEAHSRHFARQPAAACDPRFGELAGVPVLESAAARLAARIVRHYACGDHTLFVGYVEALELGEGQDDPLLFYSGRYAKLVSTRQAADADAESLPFLY